MTALCVPFFRYQPHSGEYYRVFFEQLLKGLELWGDEFDHLYILDQDMNFTREDAKRLVDVKLNSTIIPSSEPGHHWVQIKNAIPQIKEDRILFMDNDVLIWKKGIIKSWFNHGGVVTAFDGSGGLKDQVQFRFPLLKKLDATRMGSYYFILSQDVLKNIPNYDFSPINYPTGTYIHELGYTTQEGDWSDSFGLFTIKLLELNPHISIIDDDRSSIYLTRDWIRETGNPKRLGYYHIRNGNLPIYTLASKISHPEDYVRVLKVTPTSELTREFAWFDFISNYHQETLAVMADMGISEDQWSNYMDKFKEYHGL